ncbi:MAG: helix-turn-helix domain-containing protein [Pseudomonadota bacterium]|nr:helix-turn-helix domain-containing protein [Pseudomonadota bacterium]
MSEAPFTLSETRHAGGDALGLHRHRDAYLALPLDGAYEESSVDGRFACAPGVAVLHGEWHAHADRFGAGGGLVLNISLPRGVATAAAGSALIAVDIVEVEKLARRSPRQAAGAVLEERRAAAPPQSETGDWLDRFAETLRRAPQARIAALAVSLGVSREHAARRMKQRLGVEPSALRGEMRFRLAAELLGRGEKPAAAALAAGYADQSHMTRDMKARAGATPRALRRA